MMVQLKKGDRVIGNAKNPATSGRVGTVLYVSGTDCWVRFDDNNAVEGGIHWWFFEPVGAETRV